MPGGLPYNCPLRPRVPPPRVQRGVGRFQWPGLSSRYLLGLPRRGSGVLGTGCASEPGIAPRHSGSSLHRPRHTLLLIRPLHRGG